MLKNNYTQKQRIIYNAFFTPFIENNLLVIFKTN